MEEGNVRRISGTGKAKAKFEKYHGISEIKQYPDAADSTLPVVKRKRSESEDVKEEIKEEDPATPGSSKKKKKIKAEIQAGTSETNLERKLLITIINHNFI